MEPVREVFLNIPPVIRVIFYLSAAASVVLFLLGSWLKISIWLKGSDDPLDTVSRKSLFGLIKTSVIYFFSSDCLLAKRVMDRSKLRGIMLIFVYWGFIVLFIGTLIVAVDYDLGLNILRGNFYLIFSLILDIAGGLALISLAFYILRRYIFSRGKVVSSWDDAVTLLLMFLIILSGFCVEGVRLASFRPPATDWSPVGALFSALFSSFTEEGASLKGLYLFFWIIHVLSAFTFFAYLPFSKQFHMFAAQITTLEASIRNERLHEVIHG